MSRETGGGRAVRNVVVTGRGVITSAGTGRVEVTRALWERRCGVRGITRFDSSPFRCRVAGELPDFRPDDYLDRKQVRRMDRYSQLCVSAARLALEDAAMDGGELESERTGVCVGSALGGVSF